MRRKRRRRGMKRNLADWKRKMQDQTYLLQRTLKATATGNITKKKSNTSVP